MRSIVITCPEELAVNLERLHFESSTLEKTIDRYLDRHTDDADASALESPIYKEYMRDLVLNQTEYELTKEKISQSVIPEYLKQHKIQWSLNFLTHELKIDVLCDCEIPEWR